MFSFSDRYFRYHSVPIYDRCHVPLRMHKLIHALICFFIFILLLPPFFFWLSFSVNLGHLIMLRWGSIVVFILIFIFLRSLRRFSLGGLRRIFGSVLFNPRYHIRKSWALLNSINEFFAGLVELVHSLGRQVLFGKVNEVKGGEPDIWSKFILKFSWNFV